MPKPRKKPAKEPWTREDSRALVFSTRQYTGDEMPPDFAKAVRQHARELGRDMAWFAAFDPDLALAEMAHATLMLLGAEPLLPQRTAQQLADGAIPVLQDALRNPTIPDERKHHLGVLLVGFGAELGDDYASMFKDFDALMEQSLERLAAESSDQPEAVESALGALGVLAADELTTDIARSAMMTAVAVAARNSPAGAATACAIAACAAEHQLDATPLLEIFRELADHPSDSAAWYLAEFSRWPATGPWSAAAADLVRRMAARGATPRCTSFREFSHAHVSMVDGAGSRTLVCFFRTPEGGMDALVLILNDLVGLKDAWCAFEDSAQLQNAISQGTGDIAYAPCSLEFARELVADGIALHQSLDRPLPGRFFIYRSYLGQTPIEPRRRTPNLGAYMPEMILPSPTLAQGSEALMDFEPYAVQWLASDAAYDFVRSHPLKRGRKPSPQYLDEFIDAIAPAERDQFLRRFAANLEVEALAGRAIQPLNQLALRTYLAVRERVCPFSQIPFVRAIAEDSLPRILDNLKDGFSNQRDADQAALNYEALQRELFGDILPDQF